MPPRVAIQLGPIPVYWYGIMIMLGVITASFIAYQEAKRRGQDPEHVWQMFPWILIAGIVGARVGFIVVSLGNQAYRDDPLNILRIWTGGLSIQGAVIGGTVALIIYCSRYHISFFEWSDIIVPGLALAQAIGRWGNYFNQEAFGQPTTLPWGIPIDVQRQQEVAGQVYGTTTRFHPTFAYEMIWDFLNFAILMWLGRQKRFRLREGDLLWVYLVVYSIGRFFIEAIRLDSAKVGTVPVPQVIALATIVLAFILYIYRHRPGSPVPYSITNIPEDELAAYQQALPEEAEAQSPSRVRRVPASFATRKPVDAEVGGQTLATDTKLESPQPS